jgi:hypothetical protein
MGTHALLACHPWSNTRASLGAGCCCWVQHPDLSPSSQGRRGRPCMVHTSHQPTRALRSPATLLPWLLACRLLLLWLLAKVRCGRHPQGLRRV